ncbi:MAG: porphobilinogen synthase [Nitrospinota bacterium]|nr:porphobilinogen synthase [Nitrospinota bacterium]
MQNEFSKSVREDGISFVRTRRTRNSSAIRNLVRETRLYPENFVYPFFVVEGEGVRHEIPSMPGQFQLSVDMLLEDCVEIIDCKIPAIILFGIPDSKDDRATQAYSETGIIQIATKAIKERFSELCVITDVCLCEYMDHGHCGVVEDDKILNDPTLELLSQTALSHVVAGADIVAPSDMMDGRVANIRKILDGNGYSETPIMSYASKYASAFYGPFRVAAESTPSFGDRSTYQMDPSNLKEALREVEIDIKEGADIILVKPALPYLDVLSKVSSSFNLPVAAYNVSGEYSMLVAAMKEGWLDPEKAFMESLLSIRRAGADFIITYFAKDASKRLLGDFDTPLSWM